MAIPLLATVVQWLASAAAAGVVGNRADAAVIRLATGPGFRDRIADLASGTSGVRVDRAAFGEWLADQRTFDLLTRLAARPETSGDASLQEIAGRYADELVATAQEFGIAGESGAASTQRAQLEELVACTLLALWTETDPSLRPLFVLLADTTTLLEGQEQLRGLVENLADHVAARDRTGAAPGPRLEALGGLRDAIVDPGILFDQLGINRPGQRASAGPYRADFIGREWLFAQIDDFIATHGRGYVLVEGEAGVGKSTLALWLAATRGYGSHFTRLPGGREASIAVRNLGAQLITTLGLEQFAPGGTLPPVAGQPHWLHQVLIAASERQQALRPGTPLVLVVDGLDEAEPASGPPLGLPAALPDGVFVVATLRTGTPLRWLREYDTIKLKSSSESNLGDMRRFIDAVVRESKIAAALKAAHITTEWFTGAVLDQCAGIWIHLDYILREIHDGRRQPEQLNRPPRGLWGFYAESIDALRTDPCQWDTFYLPLLATLAVAQEPLTPGMLATLAGIPNRDGDVRRFLTRMWRPFCTSVAGERYQILHQSLRDYLIGMPSGEARESAEFTTTDGLELAEAARESHQRIADRYLAAWGGLEDGLPLLASDPDTADLDGGYGLRHLPAHMEAAAPDTVHRLLACEQPADLGLRAAENVWYLAHERAGGADTYLAHIARAAALAQQATATAHAEGRKAAPIGLEIRYALITASVTNLAARFPPELVAALLSKGIWRPAQALFHIRNNPDLYKRVSAYISAIPHLPEADLPAVLAAALEAAQAIRRQGLRVRAIAELVPHLPAADRAGVLASALTTTEDGSADGRASPLALAKLAPHLPEADRQRVLASALGELGDDRRRPWALGQLAPHLSPELLEVAVGKAQEISDDINRIEAVAALGPYLPDPKRHSILVDALLTAKQTSDVGRQALALAALAPALDPPLLRIAWRMAEVMTDGHARGWAEAALVPHVAAELPDPAVYALALKLIWAVRGNQAFGDPDYLQGQALAALAPQLPDELLASAVQVGLGIRSGFVLRARALAALAPRLSPALLGTALEMVQAFDDDADLEALAPHLPADLLAAALRRAQAINDGAAQAQAVAALAPHLPEANRPEILATALRQALAIPDELGKGEWNRAHALTALAPHLAEPDRPDVLAAALQAVQAISPEVFQQVALAELAPQLSPELAGTAFQLARQISDDGGRVRVLAALLPRLPEADRPEILADALRTAWEISDDEARINALVCLAPNLPEADRHETLAAALEIAQRMRYDQTRAFALARLAPHLDRSMLAVALQTAREIRLDQARATALVAIAPHLAEADRPVVIAAALETAQTITHAVGRFDALSQLVLHLPENDRSGVIAAVLEVALAGGNQPEATVMDHEDLRAMWLARLAPHLASLHDSQPAGSEPKIGITELLKGLTRRNALRVLEAAAAPVALLGGDEASAACGHAVTDVARWWP